MPTVSEADILSEVVNLGDDALTPDAARAILGWKFSDKATGRMRDLVLKANAGDLNDEESMELDRYRRVGLLVDIARAKAASTLAE
ncbi:hypothetical protein [Stratiformator vulcanicus]|uniref:Uncharacterized protein n=1 Tax=Stratiformator vulcanicus TaxID=2527980 RepID=A0A517R5J7_9PLAN|nr:hypothetical protein [Stratiformator vulcanicus]QDT39152.1 hypothetical protein Pan189_35550 [Stratiformator vulcanicus]